MLLAVVPPIMRNTDAPNRTASVLITLSLAAATLLAPVSNAGALDTTDSDPISIDLPELQTDRAPQSANAGIWLDTSDRQGVIDSYDVEFSKIDPDIGWTGDRSTCTPGTTSSAYRSAIIDRVNWFRAMGGVSATVTENATYSAKAQEAALMMSVSNKLSHGPTASTFDCFTDDGAEAASQSNLYLGRTGPHAITGYMLDPGSNNVSVGHRNWILHPTVQEFGTGDLPAEDGRPSNTLWVVDNTFAAQPTLRESQDFIAWPARGFVPGEVVFPRWSFGVRNADFTNATVTTQRVVDGTLGDTVSSPIVFQNNASGAPFSIMVWEPVGIDTNPTVDETYRITVANVGLGSVNKSYTYDVIVIGDRAAQITLPSGSNDIDAFANAAYNDFIGRDATASEKNNWIQRINSGSSRYELVAELTQSDEWAANVVDEMYYDTLGRGPDAGGRAYWINQMREGMSVARMAALFYGSPEYIAKEGNDLGRWITDLYSELLDRQPDGGGLTFWVDQTNETTSGSVALRFYQSDESRRARVQALYQSLLGRGTDIGGEDFWAEVLLNGDDLALAANLAASDEYFDKAAG